MNRVLHEGWTVTAADRRVTDLPATVPGCVHTDLLAAGVIDDPYHDDNERGLAWIGRTGWTYRTRFTWQPDGHDHVELVFEGLDTIAEIRLNDTVLGHTANMHRTYRFPVDGLLRPGDNELQASFTSPYAYAEAQIDRVGPRPGAYDEPYPFIRKMACNFGWDWGPTLVTAGIWRPVRLRSWSGVRLEQVRPHVRADGVDIDVTIDRGTLQDVETPVTVTVEAAGVRAEATLAAGQHATTLRLDLPDAERWWPRGYGPATLHTLTVTAGDDVWQRRIGLRSVELDPDAFRLIVNGTPVYVRGFNWIPDDCFPSRTTVADLTTRFTQATDAGANLLRVWGGGVYESDAFYELADSLGLMIWQDFPFACAAYPEDEPFTTEVAAEARDNVARLMHHPSLMLWCGNNENIEGHQHWGWREQLADRTWGADFYHRLLPGIVADIDPTRPYWPGTPYSGHPDHDVHDPATGTIHIWTVWGSADYTAYADYTPRFVAEFGFQGPPAYATLRAAVSDDPLEPDSPGVAHHQKAIDGAKKLLNGLGDHLPIPRTFDDWHYYTQLNQARAVTFGVHRFRALMPYCMGTIVWQLNDCWPVTSWAAVDGDGRRKPLWYALRRAYAERLVVLLDGRAAIVNDTATVWRTPLAVRRSTLPGKILAEHHTTVTVPPRAVTLVDLPADVVTTTDPYADILILDAGDHRYLHLYAEDPQIAYPPAAFDTDVTRTDTGWTVTVTATTVVRELALFPDRLDPDAYVSDQLITLLPGETATFDITGAVAADPEALVRFPVLRAVNEARP
jgi:beta-mannosidase